MKYSIGEKQQIVHIIKGSQINQLHKGGREILKGIVMQQTHQDLISCMGQALKLWFSGSLKMFICQAKNEIMKTGLED